MSRTFRKYEGIHDDKVAKHNDGKPWFKPDKKFKAKETRKQKSEYRQVMKDGMIKEFPILKPTAQWNYQ